MSDETKHSASILVSQPMLFEVLGLGKYFAGHIDDIDIEPLGENIVIRISGNDDRMPEGDDYPLCNVVCKVIDSHFQKVER